MEEGRGEKRQGARHNADGGGGAGRGKAGLGVRSTHTLQLLFSLFQGHVPPCPCPSRRGSPRHATPRVCCTAPSPPCRVLSSNRGRTCSSAWRPAPAPLRPPARRCGCLRRGPTRCTAQRTWWWRQSTHSRCSWWVAVAAAAGFVGRGVGLFWDKGWPVWECWDNAATRVLTVRSTAVHPPGGTVTC